MCEEWSRPEAHVRKKFVKGLTFFVGGEKWRRTLIATGQGAEGVLWTSHLPAPDWPMACPCEIAAHPNAFFLLARMAWLNFFFPLSPHMQPRSGEDFDSGCNHGSSTIV